MKSRLVANLIFAALSLILSACGGQTTGNSTVNSSKPSDDASANKNTTQNIVTSITPTPDGQLLKFESVGVQMTVPNSFKVQKEGDDILLTPSNVTKIYYHVPADTDWAKAFANATTALGKYIKDIKVSS